MGFVALGLGIASTFVFQVCSDKTFTDYAQTTYCCSFLVLTICLLLILIRKAEQMFQLIHGFDQLGNTSKLEQKNTIPEKNV